MTEEHGLNLKEHIQRLSNKPPEFWINIWQWIALAAFFTGILISAKYYEHKANDALAEIIDEIREKNPLCFYGGNDYAKYNSFIESQNISFPSINIPSDISTE